MSGEEVPNYDEVVKVARSIAVHKGYPYTLERYAQVLTAGRMALVDRQAGTPMLVMFDRIVEDTPIHGGGFKA